MSGLADTRLKGIASLFDTYELKKFVKFYISLIFLLEIIIFGSCFLFQLEPVNLPFPWKYYFLASFLVPIAVTFLLGIFITAFNLFVFGHSTPQSADSESSDNDDENDKENNETTGHFNKINASLTLIRQMPFLLTLLILGIGAIIFAQLDNLIIFLGEIGVKTVEYALIILGVVFAVAVVFALIWIFMKYKLEKMKYDYKYKQDVMSQLGLLVIDKKTVITPEGKVITQNKKKKLLPEKTKSNKDALLIAQSTEQQQG